MYAYMYVYIRVYIYIVITTPNTILFNNFSGPFKATKIWHDLIDHLKSKVELKRRRHKMKSIDSCFTGTDAVDVVLHFLLNDRDTFSADLSREKAVKVNV